LKTKDPKTPPSQNIKNIKSKDRFDNKKGWGRASSAFPAFPGRKLHFHLSTPQELGWRADGGPLNRVGIAADTNASVTKPSTRTVTPMFRERHPVYLTAALIPEDHRSPICRYFFARPCSGNATRPFAGQTWRMVTPSGRDGDLQWKKRPPCSIFVTRFLQVEQRKW